MRKLASSDLQKHYYSGTIHRWQNATSSPSSASLNVPSRMVPMRMFSALIVSLILFSTASIAEAGGRHRCQPRCVQYRQVVHRQPRCVQYRHCQPRCVQQPSQPIYVDPIHSDSQTKYIAQPQPQANPNIIENSQPASVPDKDKPYMQRPSDFGRTPYNQGA